ncbi:tRNA modification GTPase TrmE, putative [Babesia bigemina]|uniref:tRNA modification GTPase TrmE, putative n=1 Tax=Babesia bigemina TaxID=5866 RepID=A0A061DDA8_BABBI|nr:tRNA modification GTPase TrmE, putative [Babesia bigemina]CDR96110.1 tRNA modification GTPase TrmE, putative [Babesia bigemina]|eukprot:XP_012768296.1 tRNA modification GTPase TrmE, putative [Babesia bigemina]
MRCLFGILLFVTVAEAWRISKWDNFKLFPAAHTRHLSSSARAQFSAQTVYGLSSAIPDGGCGIAVTRISGRQSLKVLELLTKNEAARDSKSAFKCVPRMATLRTVYDQAKFTPIDKAITIYFPGPNSYTGEDVVEIHTHGSRAIVSQLFAALRCISRRHDIGIRQAERGEFTRRAFYNGKMDLTQAEAIRDIISSETALEMQNAALKLHGGLTQLYGTWADRLNQLLATVEARIEFDEQALADLNATHKEQTALLQGLTQIQEEIEAQLEDSKGEILTSGANVSILGPPNAGKSSLMNAICDRRVAIVSDMPGTTRDLIQVKYDLNGLKVTFVDTAGIREMGDNVEAISHNEVEKQGIEKALQHLNDTRLAIFLFDHTNVEHSQYALDTTLQNVPHDSQLIICVSKVDLITTAQMTQYMRTLESRYGPRAQITSISNREPQSIEAMLQLVHQNLEKDLSHVQKQPFVTDARHKSHLRNVLQQIKIALKSMANTQSDLEIVAENIREATSQIGYILGEQTNEHVLDAIFRTFCVGK